MKFDRPAAETAPWVLSVEDAAWACRVIGPVPISGDAHPGLIPRQRWKWTCQECGATGPMPEDILAPQHDCKSRGPFDEVARLLVEPVTESTGPVHWVGDAPTSLHGNGAASFDLTTRDEAEVTCSLCLTLLDRESSGRERA